MELNSDGKLMNKTFRSRGLYHIVNTNASDTSNTLEPAIIANSLDTPLAIPNIDDTSTDYTNFSTERWQIKTEVMAQKSFVLEQFLLLIKHNIKPDCGNSQYVVVVVRVGIWLNCYWIGIDFWGLFYKIILSQIYWIWTPTILSTIKISPKNLPTISLKCNFSSPVTLLHIFRTPFLRNTSGRLLLNTDKSSDTTTWNSKSSCEAKNINESTSKRIEFLLPKRFEDLADFSFDGANNINEISNADTNRSNETQQNERKKVSKQLAKNKTSDYRYKSINKRNQDRSTSDKNRTDMKNAPITTIVGDSLVCNVVGDKLTKYQTNCKFVT